MTIFFIFFERIFEIWMILWSVLPCSEPGYCYLITKLPATDLGRQNMWHETRLSEVVTLSLGTQYNMLCKVLLYFKALTDPVTF